MTATCALCGWRDSVDVTDWDGRTVPACGVCLEPPDVADDYEYEPADLTTRFATAAHRDSSDRSSRNAVVAALRQLKQATAGELAEFFGCTDTESRPYDILIQNLKRMKARGEVETFEVTRGGRGSSGKSYRLSPGVDIIDIGTPRRRVVEEYQKGLCARDIANKLGVTYPSVKSLLYRARQLGEIPAERRRGSSTCAACGRKGHNARTCELNDERRAA